MNVWRFDFYNMAPDAGSVCDIVLRDVKMASPGASGPHFKTFGAFRRLLVRESWQFSRSRDLCPFRTLQRKTPDFRRVLYVR